MKKNNKPRSQPRIPGITRLPKHGSFHPDVAEVITNLAHNEDKTFSYIIVEIVSDFFGVDCRTGDIYDNRKLRKGQ
jgi:hypothetical protein